MAEHVGRLRAVLGMDRRGFSTGLRGARAEISTFASQMRGYAGMIAAAMGAAGAGSLSLVGAEAMQSASEISRLATLANATPEAFQTMALAARTVGIEQDKLSDILKDTNDRIGEFATTGSGQMKDFFEQIAPRVGVTIRDFQRLSGPQALELYVSSLQKAGVNQQQMTFYMEAMADEATSLVPLLRDGGAGMEAMGRKATALGAIMDQKTITALREAKRAISEVQLVFVGIRNMIAKEVVPGMAGLARAFTTAAEDGKPLGDAIRGMVAVLPRFIAYAGTAVGALVAWRAATVALRIATVGLKAALISTGVGALVVAAGELVYQFTRLVSVTGSFGGAMTLLGDLSRDVWDRMKRSASLTGDALWGVAQHIKAGFLTAFADIAEGFGALTRTLAQGASLIPGVEIAGLPEGVSNDLRAGANAASDNGAAMLSSVGASLEGIWSAPYDSLEALRKKAAETGDAFGDLGETGALAGEALAGGADKAKQKASDLKNVIGGLKDDLARLKATMFGSELDGTIFDALKKAGVSASSASGQQITGLVREIDGMERLKTATDDWRSSIRGAFTSFAKGASSFKDALGQILDKLADITLDRAFDSLTAGFGGSRLLGGVLSGFGIGSIGANANGTDNWRGGLSALHERGGEIYDLPKGTRVIPHDVSMRMAESAGRGASSSYAPVYNIDARGAQAGVGEQIAQALAQYDQHMPDRIAQIDSTNGRRF
ncbi:hypothetical protein ERN12_05930 [Rhodobacteraceae bacterium]|nr:hypothetical protein ERN12_05930 [Paracoccaceae bacterium]